MSFLEPVSIILVTAGSWGEKLLFRYPFCDDSHVDGKNILAPLIILAPCLYDNWEGAGNYPKVKGGRGHSLWEVTWMGD